jgi:sugar lactone lactonase YvrE
MLRASTVAIMAWMIVTPLARAAEEAPSLEIVAEFEQPPGNATVTPDGRIITSMHPIGAPFHRVVEVLPDGTKQPYPNEEWSTPPDKHGIGLASIIGIHSDPNGVLWMLDIGNAQVVPKLVAWDTRREVLVRVIHIPPPASRPDSFMQDFAVDPIHAAVFIADMGRRGGAGMGQPAIVVVDLATGFARRALDGHKLLEYEPDARMVIDGKPVTVRGPGGKAEEPALGLNPITIDPTYTWVYFGAMRGKSVYRVRATDLLDESLDDKQLAGRVERYGDKGVSDGISIDGAGKVYVTDVNNNAIGVLSADGEYRLLIQDDEKLSWPDALSYGPDGYFYVTVNQLHRHAALNNGVNETKPPFRIVRFKSLAPGTVGR